MRQGQARALHLPRAALPAQLPRRLDKEKDAVHSWMAVRQSSAIGVQRKWTAGRGALPADERAALSPLTEAQGLQGEDNRDGERVVDLRNVNLCRGETCPCERRASR